MRHQHKAVAAVEVEVGQLERGGGAPRQVFTFCLEKIASGGLANCWMTVGVRVGDYANV